MAEDKGPPIQHTSLVKGMAAHQRWEMVGMSHSEYLKSSWYNLVNNIGLGHHAERECNSKEHILLQKQFATAIALREDEEKVLLSIREQKDDAFANFRLLVQHLESETERTLVLQRLHDIERMKRMAGEEEVRAEKQKWEAVGFELADVRRKLKAQREDPMLLTLDHRRRCHSI